MTNKGLGSRLTFIDRYCTGWNLPTGDSQEYGKLMLLSYLLMVWQCHAINRHSADLVSKENSCVPHRRVKSRKAARDTQHIDGLAQDCRISTVNALESSQSCNRPTICTCGNKKKRTLLIEEVCTAGPFNSILISQIPQCILQISHNAPICNEMCTCLLQIGALWDLANRSI